MTQLDLKVKQLPGVIKQQVILIEKMKDEISMKSTEQFNEICTSLKVDSFRIRDVEEKLKTQKDFEKKLDFISNEVTKLKTLEDGVFQSHCFIERALPMLIHH